MALASAYAIDPDIFVLDEPSANLDIKSVSYTHLDVYKRQDMLRSKQMEPEEMFVSANYIFNEGKRLEALSLKLLELMVLNRQDFERRRVNPRLLIEEIAGLMQPVMEKNQMTLRAAAQNSIVLIEPDLFKTLLVNLIDNARKASQEGGVIELLGKIDGRDYVFCVKDHGRGIPPEEIRKITDCLLYTSRCV